MPPAKKAKKSAASQSKAAPKRPTTEDIEGQSEFATLARQHWLKRSKLATKVTVKNDVLKREIWDPLAKEDLPFKSLLVLEGLQTPERYVTPQASSAAPRALANVHTATCGPASGIIRPISTSS